MCLTLIELIEVSKSYRIRQDVKKVVLKNISLNIKERDFIGIQGPSGSGKTTLLNLIIGNIPLDSGKYIFNHTILNKPNDVLFVPQEPFLIPYLSVNENFEEIPNNLIYFLDLFQLRNLVDSYPDELSGGELRRVAICKAIFLIPKLLILDEPSANLDISWKFSLIKIFDELKKIGITLIISTHNKDLVKNANKNFKIKNFSLINLDI